tara:strand:+ start:57130 stop:57951 length:822 start_codon:yes stop_codon:yes gene_type:complete
MCAILAALVSPAMAQEEGAVAGPNTGAVSFGMGVDFTTAYFYRGILQENQGLIYQPWADATFQLNDKLSVYLGTWNSIQDNNAGSDWYESDFFVGANYAVSECLSLDVSYIWLNTPSAGGEFSQEVNIGLAYDDSALWGDGFDGLQPSFLVGIETSGTSDGFGAGDKGVYYELGIAPSFTVVDSATSPITLTIPVTVGLGSDYYQVSATDDDTFGFVDAGLDFSMPLSFVPAQFGSWEAAAGVHFLFLGDNTEAINNGSDFEVIGTFGISMSY